MVQLPESKLIYHMWLVHTSLLKSLLNKQIFICSRDQKKYPGNIISVLIVKCVIIVYKLDVSVYYKDFNHTVLVCLTNCCAHNFIFFSQKVEIYLALILRILDSLYFEQARITQILINLASSSLYILRFFENKMKGTM